MRIESLFGQRVVAFYNELTLPHVGDRRVQALNPFAEPDVRNYVTRFSEKFYSDVNERVFVFGINPGRFGSGLTGVPFTDPVALEAHCGIKNDLAKRVELSSEFIYTFVNRWGGPERFYRSFFLTAVSPVGFIRDGVNYNYYDDRALLSELTPYIIATMRAQIAIGARRTTAIVLGKGRNQAVFSRLNAQYQFFDNVQYLEHPRFIMQYRRKTLRTYIESYEDVFTRALDEERSHG